MNKVFICILCPNGCEVAVEYENDVVRSVAGNLCAKGEEYVRQEITAPMRNIATSVLVEGGELPLCSVRLTRPIPKGKIMDVMEHLRGVTVTAPVHAGDVIVANVLGLGADVIATRTIEKEHL